MCLPAVLGSAGRRRRRAPQAAASRDTRCFLFRGDGPSGGGHTRAKVKMGQQGNLWRGMCIRMYVCRHVYVYMCTCVHV